jgi:hypothetical protein
MNNELEGVWMEASVTLLKVVSQRRLKGARQSQNKYLHICFVIVSLPSIYAGTRAEHLILGSGFEPGTPQIWSNIANW